MLISFGCGFRNHKALAVANWKMAGDYTYAEVRYLRDATLAEAAARRLDIILEISGDEYSAEAVDVLEQDGYEVFVEYVHCSPEEARDRIRQRANINPTPEDNLWCSPVNPEFPGKFDYQNVDVEMFRRELQTPNGPAGPLRHRSLSARNLPMHAVGIVGVYSGRSQTEKAIGMIMTSSKRSQIAIEGGCTMKKLMLVVLALPLTAAWAQSPFDGTWKADLSKLKFPSKPDVFELKDGRYKCPTCIPTKIDVAADGQDQKVSGNPYMDTISVKVVDPKTVEIVTKKAGKVVGKEQDSVSDDGNQFTSDWTGRNSPDSPEMSVKAVHSRVGKAPAGAHAISGSWRTEKATDVSESIVNITFKGIENGMEMSQPNGVSYSAKFDGKDYPYKGDPGTTAVSLKRIGDREIEETDKYNGKTIAVADMTVAPDGRTMTTVIHDKRADTTFTIVSDKQ